MRLLKIFFLSLLSLILILFLILVIISPGKTSPIKDENGNMLPNSIAVIERPLIGGVEQGMVIRGADMDNAVMLVLHGGPGVPSISMVDDFRAMEKLFTLCYWEQRGAGMSYSKKEKDLTLEQLINDAVEVTQYLREKFRKQKIYVLGHSWGTFLGSLLINRRPDLFHAYLGIGQIGDTYASEVESYRFVINEATKRNDKKVLRLLQKDSLPSATATSDEWWDYLKRQRKYVSKYGGSKYGATVNMFDRIKAIILCREYTLSQKLNYAAAVRYSMDRLWADMMKIDLTKELKQQQLPVYIFQGVHDHQTSYLLAKNYFDSLTAPKKAFYTFERSAHWPHVEEYGKFERIIIEEVLK